MESNTSNSLFNALSNQIDLVWLAGRALDDKPLTKNLQWTEQVTLIGHLNLIHPNRIQVIGPTELNYWNTLKKNSQRDTLKQIFSSRVSALIVTDGEDPPHDFITAANAFDIPLFSSEQHSYDLIDNIRHYLSGILSNRRTRHGVFMEVLGAGVLIAGDSGIGKSELALELISRGHRLIADDAPVFSRISLDTINGTCPEILQDFMEVRGLGMLNIRSMYGSNAIKMSKHLRLIIKLALPSSPDAKNIDRLFGSHSKTRVMGVDISTVTVPVASGRNMAVVIEAAVHNYILQQNGYNPAEDFITRQSNLMRAEEAKQQRLAESDHE